MNTIFDTSKNIEISENNGSKVVDSTIIANTGPDITDVLVIWLQIFIYFLINIWLQI